MEIDEIIKKYRGLVNIFDLEILIASSLNKTREFVLSHPEYIVTGHQLSIITKALKRRIKGEPVAYILGHKEFYGLDFKVNKHTLVPRPETELMVEMVLDLLRSKLRNTSVIDIGTGSGCIITSIAHTMEHGILNKDQKKLFIKYYATDISDGALKIAKQNAKSNEVKIKFLHGNLLEPFVKIAKSSVINHQSSLIITANLPYLSKEIYNSAPIDVKKYEPKSALYSPEEGLKHYRLLLEQLREVLVTYHLSLVTVFLEISPEQKKPIEKLIRSVLPKAKIHFIRDLTKRWRIVKIEL